MTTTVSLTDYCKDPSEYQDELDENTIILYNNQCDAINQLNSQYSGFWDTFGNIEKDEAHILAQTGVTFVESMFSPAGLEILSAMIGITITAEFAYTVGVHSLINGFSEGVSTAMEAALEDGFSSAAINATALVDAILTDLTIDTFFGDAGFYAVGAILKGIALTGEALDAAMIAILVLNLVGMVFDLWDPCHLQDEMSADALDQYNQIYNQVFRENTLKEYAGMVDSYGRIYYVYVWPLEYFADKTFLRKEKEDYYHPIRFQYALNYLSSLSFNSKGQPICWPEKEPRLLNSNDLLGISRSLAITAAGDNTVVYNWLIKWWPLLLFLFIVLIIVVVVVIK